jgi:hypothetical protein
LRDLRVGEVVQLDLQLDAKGKVEAYRAKLKVSSKFEGVTRWRVGKRAQAPCPPFFNRARFWWARRKDAVAFMRKAELTAPTARSHRH